MLVPSSHLKLGQRGRAELNDETLRDGTQSPSVRHPSLEAKIRALYLMEKLGVSAVSLGLPGAGPTQAEDVRRLAAVVTQDKLSLEVHCAARTKVEDLVPIADIVQSVGAPVGVYAFLGTSPIRCYAEGWTVDGLLRTMETAVNFALRRGLEVAFVTEDTVRSRPGDIERLFLHAIHLGVRRLVLCDTVGHATPVGTQRLVAFVQQLVARSGAKKVFLDWHGHDDRGLAVANSLAAEAAGVDRIHGTMLGVGERCGNAALDQLLYHRRVRWGQNVDAEAIQAYRHLIQTEMDWSVSPGYPWPWDAEQNGRPMPSAKNWLHTSEQAERDSEAAGNPPWNGRRLKTKKPSRTSTAWR